MLQISIFFAKFCVFSQKIITFVTLLINREIMEARDLNRLKVVLAEKNARTSGLLNNWVKILQQFPNGVQTLHSRIWRT